MDNVLRSSFNPDVLNCGPGINIILSKNIHGTASMEVLIGDFFLIGYMAGGK